MSRVYVALDVVWPTPPGDDDIERVLAEIDDARPTAVDDPDRSRVRIFFDDPAARTLATALIRAFNPSIACQPIDVPGDDWAAKSQAGVTLIRVGALVVAPPWDVPVDRRGVIIINPSMGFGTGHHASTRLCLALMQQIPMNGTRVLDVGTGSGVLAIAAAALGADTVLAIDCDEDALTAARENLDPNGADHVVTFEHVDLDVPRDLTDRAPFDVVTANLTGGMLVRHAATLARCVRQGGALVVSGVMADEERAVAVALGDAGLRLASRRFEEEWVGLRLLGAAC